MYTLFDFSKKNSQKCFIHSLIGQCRRIFRGFSQSSDRENDNIGKQYRVDDFTLGNFFFFFNNLFLSLYLKFYF